MATTDLRFEAFYPHAPARVWLALTDAHLIEAWLLPNDFLPKIGHFFTFRARPQPGFDGVIHGEVIECHAPHRLGYKWSASGLATRVHWTLTAHPGGGTDVVLEHDGFIGMKGLIARPVAEKNWSRLVLPVRLRAVLDALDEGGRLPEGTAVPPLR